MDKLKDTLHKPITFRNQIHDLIKKRIIEGKYHPGERLYEAKLAREFEVSRSPIREAVRTLEEEGLLIVDEKAGIYVYKTSLKDLTDIYECRKVLESLAITLATIHATEDDLEEIEEIHIRAEDLYKQHESNLSKEMIYLYSSFHDAIIKASKNIRLEKQLENLRTLTFFYRKKNIENRERCKEILEQHAEILRHLKNRDTKASSDAMFEHITADLSYLTKIISEPSTH